MINAENNPVFLGLEPGVNSLNAGVRQMKKTTANFKL